MGLWKRAVLGAVILLACAGVYTALINMPILSGCTFYGECPSEFPPTPAVASTENAGDASHP